ncbi:MAG: twin-arginine translocase subunit TatC, partial [Candidatus Acidiferrales bacterium]
MAIPSLPSSTSRSLEPEGESKMSFLEHLIELRKRLLYSAVAIGAGMVIGFFMAERVFGLIARPMLRALHDAHLEEKLVYTSPTGVINLLITLGLYLGVVIASP